MSIDKDNPMGPAEIEDTPIANEIMAPEFKNLDFGVLEAPSEDGPINLCLESLENHLIQINKAIYDLKVKIQPVLGTTEIAMIAEYPTPGGSGSPMSQRIEEIDDSVVDMLVSLESMVRRVEL